MFWEWWGSRQTVVVAVDAQTILTFKNLGSGLHDIALDVEFFWRSFKHTWTFELFIRGLITNYVCVFRLIKNIEGLGKISSKRTIRRSINWLVEFGALPLSLFRITDDGGTPLFKVVSVLSEKWCFIYPVTTFPPHLVQELNRYMKLSGDVLRFYITFGGNPM